MVRGKTYVKGQVLYLMEHFKGYQNNRGYKHVTPSRKIQKATADDRN
jgi:hypothetical protein